MHLLISKIKEKHLVIRISITENKSLFLIDNESEIELINETFAQFNKLKLINLKKKERIRLMLSDEEVAQILNKAVKVEVKTRNHREQLFCYVAKLNTYALILRNEWLQTHNLVIDWRKREMKFLQECIKMNCIKKKNNTKAKNKEFVEIKTISFKLTKRIDHETFLFHFRQDFEKRLTSLCAIATAKISSNDHAKFLKTKSKYIIEQLKNRVFEEYHKKIEIFVRRNANKLIEHKKEDHEINLKSKSEISYVQNYWLMSKSELKAIRPYLNEHLKKKVIRFSIFKASASMLIAKKSEEDLRICVNYRALNAIIEKSRYSISLINETLVKLFKAAMFIKLNVILAFNRIRIKKEHEWLIVFNTRYNQFEYLIMSFELCNASTTFQNYINSILQDYLNYFCIAYINDILIYNTNKKEHAKHVLKVLRRLRLRDLQLNIDKCAFEINEMLYLRLIINTEDIKMNSKKMQIIIDWKVSKSMKEVLSFIEFVNFYRRFIKNYSKKTKSLSRLAQEEQYLIKSEKRKNRCKKFVWTKKCQKAFLNLKAIFVVASILTHFDVSLEIWLKTDASDHVIAEIMFQMHEDILRSVTYFFKKMNSIECNYMIYDKELLAIIKEFETWRSELISVKDTIKMYINHKNLEYFMTTKELNRRQARWAEFLFEFDFTIMYRSEKQREKSNALIRRKQDLSVEVNDSRREHQRQTVLKENQLNRDVKEALALCVWLDRRQKGQKKQRKRAESDDFARSEDRVSVDEDWRPRTHHAHWERTHWLKQHQSEHSQWWQQREESSESTANDSDQRSLWRKQSPRRLKTSENERRQKITAQCAKKRF